MNKGIILILTGLLLSGCGVVKRGTTPWEEEKPSPKNTPASKPPPKNDIPIEASEEPVEKAPEEFIEESKPTAVQETQQFLRLAYQDWKGTPYLLGGSGYDGIDCSAFMQVVFEDYFSIQIPRTTREQLTAGKEIQRSQIKTGDLVFFKTGRTSYHVGVMINKKEFLHASTSNGVKISKLSYPFWKETYLTSKRIFN